MAEPIKRFCEKCNGVMNQDEFYQSNNLEKYPDGYVNQCKRCYTMHVNNFEPSTYTWILQEVDVPYIPEEWNKLLLKYGRDKKSLTGMTILGRYLAKMKLKQFRDFRWADNDFLRELSNSKIKDTMAQQGYGAAEIEQVISTATFQVPQGDVEIPDYVNETSEDEDGDGGGGRPNSNNGGYYGTVPVDASSLYHDEDDEGLDLTNDDIKYLRLKWGRAYRPFEWVQLEQLYEQMTKSYDIQSAGDVNSLILMCKTSLKANQLLDLGDVDGAQKMSKTYNDLMRSGKWTAAQNKTEENQFIDSIGELVALCETDGFFPRYYHDSPQDKVDRVLQDMQIYTRQLVTEELGLGNLIENSIKGLEKEREQIEAAANDTEQSEEDKLFQYDNVEEVLSLDAYEEYNDFESKWNQQAQDVYSNLEDEF